MSCPDALVLLGSVWSVLVLGAASSPWVGRELATLGAYLVATALVLGTGRGIGHRGRPSARLVCIGALLGVASGPGWLLALGAAFELLGMHGSAPPAAVGVGGWLGAIVLAPIFEEVLYRERLLVALRVRLGVLPALVASSLLFALPHLEERAIVAAALVGLALGVVRLATGEVAPCVGLHAGLNLGACLAAAPSDAS